MANGHYPPAVTAAIIKPVGKPEEAAKDLPVYHAEGDTSDKALVTVIFPSSDPAVLAYNLKGQAAQHTMMIMRV